MVGVPIATEHIQDQQMIDSLIGNALGGVVLSLIGRLCLYVRFWNKNKVKKELIAKYDNFFSMAGATLIWLLVAWILLIGISIGLLAILYGMIRSLF